MNSSKKLAQAAHAIANDDRQKTREFIAAFFNENEERGCVNGWLFQAWTCDSLTDTVASLNKALELDPSHEGAQAGLNFFNGLQTSAANQIEAERLEAERLEAERIENERLEAERLEAERIENERIEAERIEAEAERIEAERLETERLEAERLETERIENERLEAERLEAERLEAERLEAERLEAERLEAERLEAERLEAERLEAERLEAERLETERLETERLEAERLETERLETERLETERLETERLETERLEAKSTAAQAAVDTQAGVADDPQVEALQQEVESLVEDVQYEISPVAQETQTEFAGGETQAQPSSDKPVILAVDDSPTIRKLVTITLREQGYEVITAADGIEALNILAESLPSLVLSDINMPRLGGYKLCKFIKKHKRTASIPVVMLSGKDGMVDKMRGKLCGVDGFIGKPFNADDLIKIVQQYLPAPAES